MLLTPHYGTQPVMAVESRFPGPHPVLRQRRRLGEVLSTLSTEEWRAPSRCDAWSSQDVVSHLTTTNRFWVASINAGLAGDPTRFLATFDPVASPLEHVDAVRDAAPSRTLDAYLESVDALASLIETLDDHQWDMLAEAPPGHVPILLVADHALWDAWIHERDILLPLGRETTHDDAEIITALRYAAGLGPAFGLCVGLPAPAPVELRSTAPEVRVVVEVRDGVSVVHDGPSPAGAAVVELDATQLLEAVSFRDTGMPVPAEVRDLTSGLGTAFDQPV